MAIVYHDDNERGIPHAHVVVNNTNIETGRRLQDPDPKALAASLQELAEAQGLTALRPPEATGVAARAQRRSPKRAPETFRSEYVRRAEQELTERGEYSWTADIRARVRIARTVSRSETEFRSILGTMGVTVADNSPKAERRDWIYALASHPSRRISGERMGLAYGRERLEPLLRSGGVRRLEDAGERAIAAIAKRAVAVGDLTELRSLSGAVALIDASRARCLDDLDALLEKSRDEAAPQLVSYVKEKGLLPKERPALDLSDVNGESLWLCSYYYEAAQAYKDEKGPKGLPVARRRDGWSFLLADAEDMQRLNRVTLGGETEIS